MVVFQIPDNVSQTQYANQGYIQNVPVPQQYPQPMNMINYRTDNREVNAKLSDKAVLYGAAAVVGLGIGYCVYKKYFRD